MVEQIEFSHEFLSAHISQKLVLGQMASTNEIIKKIKSLNSENSILRKKMHSLKESAKLVKTMYEEQYKKNDLMSKKVNDLNVEIRALKLKNLELENSSTNAQLTYKQQIAEMEKKIFDSSVTSIQAARAFNLKYQDTNTKKSLISCKQDSLVNKMNIKKPVLQRVKARPMKLALIPKLSNVVPTRKFYVDQSTMTYTKQTVNQSTITNTKATVHQSTITDMIPTFDQSTLTDVVENVDIEEIGTVEKINSVENINFDIDRILQEMVIRVPQIIEPLELEFIVHSHSVSPVSSKESKPNIPNKLKTIPIQQQAEDGKYISNLNFLSCRITNSIFYFRLF